MSAGLSGEHVPASGVARSSTGVQHAAQQASPGAAWRQELGHHLDPGYLPAQREGRHLSRRHRRQPDAETDSFR